MLVPAAAVGVSVGPGSGAGILDTLPPKIAERKTCATIAAQYCSELSRYIRE
ncbi:hypothetical protein ACIRVF_25035 [Kitasatospora sp. NPDC101157]|uniref:hypothetical protein n=1 Tax=Kitasatospora sp. NPDC101157 TaxID=3364098 RepID=UPI00382D7698